MRIKNTGIWCKETSKKSQYASKTTIIHVICIIVLSLHISNGNEQWQMYQGQLSHQMAYYQYTLSITVTTKMRVWLPPENVA
jgi:hypothetical protein